VPPLTLSSDKRHLLAANSPDKRARGLPGGQRDRLVHTASARVGLDPVAVEHQQKITPRLHSPADSGIGKSWR
jgi:hypothetical protein